MNTVIPTTAAHTRPTVPPRASARGRTPLGRLTALGITEPWQAALLLPVRWDDLRTVVRNFRALSEGPALLAGRAFCSSKRNWDRRAPRLSGTIVDSSGARVGFTVFGDSRDFSQQVQGAGNRPVHLYGTIKQVGGRLWLTSPELVTDSRWIGRLRPVYPGKTRVIGPDTVRQRLTPLLDTAIPEASKRLRAKHPGLDLDRLEPLLASAHRPATPEEGRAAQEALERLAAQVVGDQVRQAALSAVPSRFRSPADWMPLAGALPFRLTADQQKAVRAIHADLLGTQPMRRLLSGDVGTGKTAVFAIAAAACVNGGGRAAILSPNARVAEQIYTAIHAWWPELDCLAVTGESDQPDEPLDHHALLVGTTALLHRNIGMFDLVVIDEQQKFSRAQREQLLADGTHLLEASATCIPRSQALVRYGALSVSRLHQGHARKQISTRIWYNEERSALFAGIRDTIAAGGQVIVVYPRKTVTDDGSVAQKHTADEAFATWNRVFPGRVALAHGGLDEARNEAAMQALRNNQADVLVATTVVEVGIDLPRVRRVTVMHPEFLGLTQLHQLRGRAARTGGQGWFDLYLPGDVGDKTMQRLEAMTRTNDGFELANMDMRLRGTGDLSEQSERQWGADESFLLGRPVRLDLLDELLGKEPAENPF